MSRSLVTILLMGTLSISESSYAVNWLALQGTERPEAPRSRLFGFAWIDYQDTDDGRVPVGPFAGQEAVSNQIGPQLDSPSQVTARRLRLGVRGRLRNKNLNYLLRLQSGDNGVTRLNQGNRVRLVEASLTLNHLSGAQIRVGMFKYPGSEEGLQIIPPRDYINFTNITNRLLLERFFESDGSNPLDENSPGPAGIFRDFGVMVFDAFKMKAWEHTYAAMVGNGAGVSVSNLSGSNDDEDIYLYWSSEKNLRWQRYMARRSQALCLDTRRSARASGRPKPDGTRIRP